jgi:hypothetical protein
MNDALKPRWYRLTPDRLVIGLLIVEGLLWLSERFQWPTWHKGYAVLIAVAAVGVAMLLMLLWFVIAIAFRLRFQFSIRSLLVLVVVVALPSSWLAVEMKKAREQKEAVAAIVSGGGHVSYDWQVDTNVAYLPNAVGYLPSAQPTCPSWLRGLLGDDFVGEVVYVRFVGGLSQFTEARQGRLRCLSQIKKLMLFSNKGEATDADLNCLAGLPQLRELQCFTTRDPSVEMKTLQQALPNCEVRVIFDIQNTPQTPMPK